MLGNSVETVYGEAFSKIWQLQYTFFRIYIYIYIYILNFGALAHITNFPAQSKHEQKLTRKYLFLRILVSENLICANYLV